MVELDYRSFIGFCLISIIKIRKRGCVLAKWGSLIKDDGALLFQG